MVCFVFYIITLNVNYLRLNNTLLFFHIKKKKKLSDRLVKKTMNMTALTVKLLFIMISMFNIYYNIVKFPNGIKFF